MPSVKIDIVDNCIGELAKEVYRGGAISGPWTMIANLLPSASTYTDLSAPLGTVWYFVRCVAGAEQLDSAAQSIVLKQMTGVAPVITLSQV